jgi:imidazole glycerol-phosphate synthase subunit HisF
MLSKRLIACLDVRNGCVVKGVNFEALQQAGDPAALARRYNVEGTDKVVVLDVTATLEGRRAFEATIQAVSRELFIPLTVGGGIRTEADAAAALDAGADKVGVNSAAIARPDLIGEIAGRFGSQVLVLSLDVKRHSVKRKAGIGDSGFIVTTHGGRVDTELDALAWAAEAIDRGVGELLVNSIDADGTKNGFDLELVAAMRKLSTVPVIASGGAGSLAHFAPAVAAGADAVLAASVFHSGELTVGEVKLALGSAGFTVR